VSFISFNDGASWQPLQRNRRFTLNVNRFAANDIGGAFGVVDGAHRGFAHRAGRGIGGERGCFGRLPRRVGQIGGLGQDVERGVGCLDTNGGKRGIPLLPHRAESLRGGARQSEASHQVLSLVEGLPRPQTEHDLAFLPIFTFQRVEAKIFSPMAYTLTFAMLGSLIISLTLIPVLLSYMLGPKLTETRNPLVHAMEQRYHKLLEAVLDLQVGSIPRLKENVTKQQTSLVQRDVVKGSHVIAAHLIDF